MPQTVWPYVVKPLLCWIDNFFENKVLLAHHPALQAMLNDQVLNFAFSQESTFLFLRHNEQPWAVTAATRCRSRSTAVVTALHGVVPAPGRGGEATNRYSTPVSSTAASVFRNLEGQLLLVHIRKKNHLDSSYLQNFSLPTEIKSVHSEWLSYLNIATVSGLLPQRLLS